MDIINKRLNLENYLIRLILLLVLYLISLLIDYFFIENSQPDNLNLTRNFEQLPIVNYYSLFHYNFLPILLFIWFVTLSLRRLHDCNKSGFVLLVPFVNFYWLFSQGDSKENKYGSPQTEV